MFQEATWSSDARSPVDERTQPWRQWWPPTKSPVADGTSDSILLDSSSQAPWMTWEFDNDKPWEKPWIQWPLAWTTKYSCDFEKVPEATHDEEFIREFLSSHPPDAVSKFNPFRTTSMMQFFQEKQGREDEKPYTSRVPVKLDSQLQSNFEGTWRKVMTTDIRGHEDLFTLDRDGFEWLDHRTALDVLNCDFDVQEYIAEMNMFLRKYFNCSDVFIYDYVRRSPETVDRDSGYSDVTRRVHCDQSPRSAIGRIKLHMGERAPELLKGRCRLVSVWRPLLPVIESWPLAACSFTATKPSDFVPLDVVYPHYAEESFEVRYSPDHRWYYKSAMTPQDLMIIKLFDNKVEDDTAFCAPHGGWRDPNVRLDAPPRRSIELRCMLFG